jgi:SH3 domain protein
MMHKLSLIKTSLFIASLLICSISSAQQIRYVTDQLEVTLRSGPSTSNSILSMLKSGDPVKIIEQDEETKYSLVETESNKKGYVLSRFLDNEASGRARFATLQVQADRLKETIGKLKQERDELRNISAADSKEIDRLKTTLSQTETELHDLKVSTNDTVLILQQNDSLKSRINELETDKQQLSEENARYKDSTAMDWFIRGASVALIAFLLGIIVTRIRWKKRDSWGSY